MRRSALFATVPSPNMLEKKLILHGISGDGFHIILSMCCHELNKTTQSKEETKQ